MTAHTARSSFERARGRCTRLLIAAEAAAAFAPFAPFAVTGAVGFERVRTIDNVDGLGLGLGLFTVRAIAEAQPL